MELVVEGEEGGDESALVKVAEEEGEEEGVTDPAALQYDTLINSQPLSTKRSRTHPKMAAMPASAERAAFEETCVLQNQDERNDERDEEAWFLMRLDREDDGRNDQRCEVYCNARQLHSKRPRAKHEPRCIKSSARPAFVVGFLVHSVRRTSATPHVPTPNSMGQLTRRWRYRGWIPCAARFEVERLKRKELMGVNMREEVLSRCRVDRVRCEK